MIDTEMTMKAFQIARMAHLTQTDKAGLPYILHPIAVAEKMGDDEKAITVAFLHDVVEDTPITLTDLKKAGFPDEVIQAIGLLTRKGDCTYMEYIGEIKKSQLATKVKLGDLYHHLEHKKAIPDSLIKRYQKAIKKLEC